MERESLSPFFCLVLNRMNAKGPIGIFDSGYGGLTVLAEIRNALPQYDFLYLGDNARAPYGSRSFDVVYEYTKQAVQELFERGCPLVILACNTASAKALRTIQQNDLPNWGNDKRVLGVIRPSTEAIGELTKSGHVGILATEGTVRSGSYAIELAKFAPHVKVTQQACPMWVPLIENDCYDSPGGRFFIQDNCAQLLKNDPLIDTVILGCTHYPILSDIISEFIPDHVNIVSQGPLVADKLLDYLSRHPEIERNCAQHGNVAFLTTEHAQTFDVIAKRFFGETVQSQTIRL